MDGISVPVEHFGRMTEFAFGGMFGFIEQQGRQSQQIIGYRRETRRLERVKTRPTIRAGGSGTPRAGGEDENYGTLTVTTPIYNTSWAGNSSLFAFSQQTRTVEFKGIKVTVKEDSYKNDLKKSLDARLMSEKCRNAMNALLKKLILHPAKTKRSD